MKYSDLTTKKDKIAFIRHMVNTDANWALKGMMRIYGNQTSEEQVHQMTKEDNKIGFCGPDAGIMSSLAEQYNDRNSLSRAQMGLVFKIMPKYAKQLMMCAEEDI